ncbi:MAG: hypothetical protein RLZZ387_2913 [Chloroflexota bacterium]|jgi:hypothetical protein
MKSLALLFGVAVSVVSLVVLSPTLPANDVTSWVIPVMSLALITQQMMRLGAGVDRLELLTAAPGQLAGAAGDLSPDPPVPPRADASPGRGVSHLLRTVLFVALPRHLRQRGSGNAPLRPRARPAPHPQPEPPPAPEEASPLQTVPPLPDVRGAAAPEPTPGAPLPSPETCVADAMPQPASAIPSPDPPSLPVAAPPSNQKRGRPADPVYVTAVDRLLAGEPIKQVAADVVRLRPCEFHSAVRYLRQLKRERLITLGRLDP